MCASDHGVRSVPPPLSLSIPPRTVHGVNAGLRLQPHFDGVKGVADQGDGDAACGEEGEGRVGVGDRRGGGGGAPPTPTSGRIPLATGGWPTLTPLGPCRWPDSSSAVPTARIEGRGGGGGETRGAEKTRVRETSTTTKTQKKRRLAPRRRRSPTLFPWLDPASMQPQSGLPHFHAPLSLSHRTSPRRCPSRSWPRRPGGAGRAWRPWCVGVVCMCVCMCVCVKRDTNARGVSARERRGEE